MPSQMLPSNHSNWDTWSYHIGCPVWNCKHWSDVVYPEKTPTTSILSWYSRAFNTVEGNSTFYGLPTLDTVRKWCSMSPEGFRFAMKFPKEISHDAMLHQCESPLSRFMEVLSILRDHERLGPTFLQLGPSFSGMHFTRLESFLSELPRDMPWAVEFRHANWFDDGENEQAIDTLLRSLEIDRVLFDTRVLFRHDEDSESELEARRRKPQTPIRTHTTAQHPLLRLVGVNDAALTLPDWSDWSILVAQWIRQGKHPYVFTHAPDDRFAPALARGFHKMVLEQLHSQHADLPGLSDMLGAPSLRQRTLFDD